ncbi:hypothetical protein SAY87_003340 [Trapa incisa]|uniref:Uncharacterized protein n=1 Tax=Trapa incisa TaxID=236973 RepID=A0AAN7QHW2_9MYRT|nr:hypothetical protein SAY87_003340 [Trapa incisa]
MHSHAQCRIWLRQEDPLLTPNGFKKFLVHSVQELELLMMHNSSTHLLPLGLRTYCAEITHDVSTKNRKQMVEKANQLDVVVTNKLVRLPSQEGE